MPPDSADALAVFLAARLDEDEAAARAAAAHVPQPHTDRTKIGCRPITPGPNVPMRAGKHWGARYDEVQGRDADPRCPGYGSLGPVVAEVGLGGRSMTRHIARHDPARVLADVAAKRAVIAAWQKATADFAATGGPEDYGTVNAYADVMGYLASAWADHPDYRQEWKP